MKRTSQDARPPIAIPYALHAAWGMISLMRRMTVTPRTMAIGVGTCKAANKRAEIINHSCGSALDERVWKSIHIPK